MKLSVAVSSCSHSSRWMPLAPFLLAVVCLQMPAMARAQVSFNGALTDVSSVFGPFGVAVDGSGNVFVADRDNNAVKEILAAGGYTTVNTLESGFSGFSN